MGRQCRYFRAIAVGDQPANALDVRVHLMDGQELVGAKQNRILNTDVLVPASSTLKIPVSCVEQGRWHHTSMAFMAGKSAIPFVVPEPSDAAPAVASCQHHDLAAPARPAQSRWRSVPPARVLAMAHSRAPGARAPA